MSKTLAPRLINLQNQIKLAAEKDGNSIKDITSVSKTHPVITLREVIEAGAAIFG